MTDQSDEWLMEHTRALTVPCYCGARENEPCKNLVTGQPLERQPAHHSRIKRAKEAT